MMSRLNTERKTAVYSMELIYFMTTKCFCIPLKAIAVLKKLHLVT